MVLQILQAFTHWFRCGSFIHPFFHRHKQWPSKELWPCHPAKPFFCSFWMNERVLSSLNFPSELCKLNKQGQSPNAGVSPKRSVIHQSAFFQTSYFCSFASFNSEIEISHIPCQRRVCALITAPCCGGLIVQEKQQSWTTCRSLQSEWQSHTANSVCWKHTHTHTPFSGHIFATQCSISITELSDLRILLTFLKETRTLTVMNESWKLQLLIWITWRQLIWIKMKRRNMFGYYLCEGCVFSRNYFRKSAL